MIILSLVPSSRSRKITDAMPAYAKILPRLNKAFALEKAPQGKSDAPRRKRREILVHIISDAVMKKLNSKYRGKATTTDVLSFSYGEAGVPLFEHEPIGEVYISAETAVRQAKQWQTTLPEELSLLTVHGALHVLGYDHERSAAAMKNMRRLEKRILEGAGLKVPGLTDR